MLVRSTAARLLHTLALAALLVSSTPPALQAQQDNTVYLPLINQTSHSVGQQAIFRTQVMVQMPVGWHNLEQMGIVILDRGEDWALVLADDKRGQQPGRPHSDGSRLR